MKVFGAIIRIIFERLYVSKQNKSLWLPFRVFKSHTEPTFRGLVGAQGSRGISEQNAKLSIVFLSRFRDSSWVALLKFWTDTCVPLSCEFPAHFSTPGQIWKGPSLLQKTWTWLRRCCKDSFSLNLESWCLLSPFSMLLNGLGRRFSESRGSGDMRENYPAPVSEFGFLHVSYLLVEDRATSCSIHWDKWSLTSPDYWSEIDQISCWKITKSLVENLTDFLFCTNPDFPNYSLIYWVGLFLGNFWTLFLRNQLTLFRANGRRGCRFVFFEKFGFPFFV